MKYKLKEIGEIISGGTPSTKRSDFYATKGIGWITPKDLSNYYKKYICHGARDISKIGLDNSSAKIMPPNSILVSSRAPIGYVAMAEESLATNQGFKSIIPDVSKVLPDYLYYLMLNSKSKLEQVASGSTFKEVSGKTMANFEVDIPEIQKQKYIISLLNPIVKKIELNNQINDNLLELAKTIFKNIIKTSSLHALTINDVGTVIGGGTPSKKVPKYWNGNIPWISPKDLSNHPNVFTSHGENSITQNGLDHSSTKLLPQKTVLFSSRAPIGYISIANNEITTDQGFKSVIPDKNYPFWFIYELLKSETPKIINEANGSTFKEISGGKLKQHKISIPTSIEVMKYNSVFLPIFEKIQQFEEEIDKLNQIKDILLNKFF